MKNTLVILGGSGASILAWAPLLAHALTGPPLPTSAINLSEVLNLVCVIAGWLFAFLVVLSILFVLFAAFKYLTAGGDPAKVSSANHMLIYTAVAIAIGILARSFPFFISSLVGGVFNGCP